ncbi:MAG: hypothetical protein PHI37_03725 [Candidatus Gracilibacteria bacterium]|nr:hypothetical protein [Candidatus Gracilibacteria bacterium]
MNYKQDKEAMPVLNLYNLFLELQNLRKKSKVLEISSKFLDSTEYGVIVDFFDQLVFNTKRVNIGKNYKKNFEHCVKYQTAAQKLSKKIDEKELNEFLAELMILYYNTTGKEFLLALDTFEMIFLVDRIIVIDRKI